MDDMSILEYYAKNATPEQHRLVNTVYNCDYAKDGLMILLRLWIDG